MKSFDTIVNLIIFLIVIWSFISKLRKKKESKPADEPKKKSGIGQIIGEIISELSQLESGKTSASVKQNPWENIIADRREQDMVLEKNKIPPPVPDAKTAVVPDKKKATAPSEHKPSPPALGDAIQDNNIQKLQNAVIWAEILAPPVGFRDS